MNPIPVYHWDQAEFSLIWSSNRDTNQIYSTFNDAPSISPSQKQSRDVYIVPTYSKQQELVRVANTNLFAIFKLGRKAHKEKPLDCTNCDAYIVERMKGLYYRTMFVNGFLSAWNVNDPFSTEWSIALQKAFSTSYTL
jgi:hypothetical protein